MLGGEYDNYCIITSELTNQCAPKAYSIVWYILLIIIIIIITTNINIILVITIMIIILQ